MATKVSCRALPSMASSILARRWGEVIHGWKSLRKDPSHRNIKLLLTNLEKKHFLDNIDKHLKFHNLSQTLELHKLALGFCRAACLFPFKVCGRDMARTLEDLQAFLQNQAKHMEKEEWALDKKGWHEWQAKALRGGPQMDQEA